MEDIKASPDQLQWVLDHNMQIRAGHRVQIADCVEAWRADRAEIARLESALQTYGRHLEACGRATLACECGHAMSSHTVGCVPLQSCRFCACHAYKWAEACTCGFDPPQTRDTKGEG